MQLFREVANSQGTLTNLALGATATSRVDYGGDHDWVRVTLEANYGYYAVMSGDGGATSLSEVFLNFRNAAGGSLDSASSSGGTTLVALGSTAAGTYYLDAAARLTNVTGDYQLQLFREVANSQGTLTNLALGATATSRVDYGGDHDWVRVTLEANYGYYAVMSGDGGANSLSEVFLNFRNAAGGSLDSNSSSGGTTIVALGTTAAGTYYLDAAARLTNVTGDYQLQLFREVANSQGTLSTLTEDQAQASRVDYGGDSDWFRMQLTAGTQYYVSILGDGSATSLTGSFVVLRNAAGATLDSFFSTDGVNEFSFTPSAGGTYYVDVSSSDGNRGYTVAFSDGTVDGTSGADRLFGTGFGDILNGLAGADILDGRGGGDVMDGGLGNDRYIVDSAGDAVVNEVGFSQGGGIDTVESWVSFTLPSQCRGAAPDGHRQHQRRGLGRARQYRGQQRQQHADRRLRQ